MSTTISVTPSVAETTHTQFTEDPSEDMEIQSRPTPKEAQPDETIELGDYEVYGELRRPSLFFIEPESKTQTILKDNARMLFSEFESKLTQPGVKNSRIKPREGQP